MLYSQAVWKCVSTWGAIREMSACSSASHSWDRDPVRPASLTSSVCARHTYITALYLTMAWAQELQQPVFAAGHGLCKTTLQALPGSCFTLAGTAA